MPNRMRIATVALAVLLTGCTARVAVESPSEQPSATAAATVSPSSTPDLTEIVISPSGAPAGMGHDSTAEGTPVLTHVVISGRAPEFFALDGFRDARATTFSGEGGALLSLALLFDTPPNAEMALDLFLDELQSEAGYGFGSGRDAELGDEGTCDEGANPALDGLQESICLWRNGRLVLIAGGPIDPGPLWQIAKAMDGAASGGGSATASGVLTDDIRDAAVDIATGYGGLKELVDRHPYDVDAVMPGPDGTVDVFMWFRDEVPLEEWALGPLCEVSAADPFTGVHARVNLETDTVVAVSPRWGIGTCLAIP
jgi:hypothetical protein